MHRSTKGRRAARVCAALAAAVCAAVGIWAIGELGTPPVPMGGAFQRQAAPAAQPAAASAATASDPGDPSAQEAAAPAASQDEAAPAAAQAADVAAPYLPDVALVQVREGATAAEVRAALADVPGVDASTVTDADVAAGFAQVALTGGTSVEEAVATLATADGPITGAQPDFVYYPDEGATASDLREGLQADASAAGAEAVDDTGAQALAAAVSTNDPQASGQWALSSMRVFEAWALAKGSAPAGGGQAVTVAVLDQGFDISHTDLKANIVAPYNARSGGTDVSGVTRHGTHVAGIVSAQAGNGVGVAGVSYNARVMPVRLGDDSGAMTSSAISAGYDYVLGKASAYNVRVISMSLGYSSTTRYVDTLLQSKVNKAREAGILSVAAAGNNNKAEYHYPSDLDNVVGVMSLAQSGSGVTRSSFSNYNIAGQTTKDITAPGTSILATLPGNAYGSLSGTSMATPNASGVFALMFAANPALTPAQAVDLVHDTAVDLGAKGFDVYYGYGEVDAAAAVAAARAKGGNNGSAGGSGSGSGSSSGSGSGSGTGTGGGSAPVVTKRNVGLNIYDPAGRETNAAKLLDAAAVVNLRVGNATYVNVWDETGMASLEPGTQVTISNIRVRAGYQLASVTDASGTALAKAGDGYVYTVTAAAGQAIHVRTANRSYTARFDGNGGSVLGGATQTAAYGGTVRAPSASRAGYSFVGWVPVKSDDASWVEVMYQHPAYGFGNDAGAKASNTLGTYSTLGQLSRLKRGTSWEFLLTADELGGSNRWQQSSDFTTSTTVQGFKKVALSWNASTFAGLVRNAGTNTMSAWTASSGNWWYAIGQYAANNSAANPGNPFVQERSLWATQPVHLYVLSDATLSTVDPSYASGYGAGASIPVRAENQAFKALWRASSYALDLNWRRDGVNLDGSNDQATADVWVNGKKVASNVRDFCQSYAAGASFKIQARPGSGYVVSDVTYTNVSGARKSVSGTTVTLEGTLAGAADVRFVTSTKPRTARYRVQHWQQRVGAGVAQNGSNYVLAQTETLSAAAGSSVTPARRSYAGFVAPAAQTATVLADGSRVVSYYYVRQTFDIGLNVYDPSGVERTGGQAATLTVSTHKGARSGVSNEVAAIMSGLQYGSTVTLSAVRPAAGRRLAANPHFTGSNAYSTSGTALRASGSSYVLTVGSAGTIHVRTANATYSLDYNPDANRYGASYAAGARVQALDAYVNGRCVAVGVSDWYPTNLCAGDVIELRNVRYRTGYRYQSYTAGAGITGVSAGSGGGSFRFTMGARNSSFSINTAAVSYALDLNWRRDGVNLDGSNDQATAVVWVDGRQVAAGVRDFCQSYAYGTPFKIQVTPAAGHTAGDVTWSNVNGARRTVSGGKVTLEGSVGGAVDARFSTAANRYTVRFLANGGTGTMAAQGFSYGVAQALSANRFAREGYRFVGWSLTASGAAQYADGQSVRNLTTVGNATVTLYARWAAVASAARNTASGMAGGTEANLLKGTTGPVSLVSQASLSSNLWALGRWGFATSQWNGARVRRSVVSLGSASPEAGVTQGISLSYAGVISAWSVQQTGVPVTRGARYEFSFWYRGQARDLRAVVNGQRVGAKPATTTSTGWQRYAVTFTAGASTLSVGPWWADLDNVARGYSGNSSVTLAGMKLVRK